MFISDFCETLLLSDQCQEVGSVLVKPQSSSTLHPHKPIPSPLLLTPTSLLVCCVSKDVTAASASKFAQKVFLPHPVSHFLLPYDNCGGQL